MTRTHVAFQYNMHAVCRLVLLKFGSGTLPDLHRCYVTVLWYLVCSLNSLMTYDEKYVFQEIRF
jgi:hypothetical protein